MNAPDQHLVDSLLALFDAARSEEEHAAFAALFRRALPSADTPTIVALIEGLAARYFDRVGSLPAEERDATLAEFAQRLEAEVAISFS